MKFIENSYTWFRNLMKPSDSWTGPDKIAHFVLFGGFPAYILAYQTGQLWVGFMAGVAIGVFKEIMDARSNTSTPSGKDLIVTWVGAIAGTAIAYIHQQFPI